jgi:hypothetical protein
MAHRTVRDGYANFVTRLNKSPQGAPDSPLLRRILAILMNEEEAGLLARLPLRPFTARKAARAWKTTEVEATRILEELAGRALLVDVELEHGKTYVLPPPMAGFFEFSLMRTRGDIDQKALSELFYQYLNVEEDFVRELFTEGETQLGRIFVQEPMLDPDEGAHVLDYERATEVIETASHIGTGMRARRARRSASICSTRRRKPAWSSSARTCSSGSTSSATAVGAVARRCSRRGASRTCIRCTRATTCPRSTPTPATAAAGV